jgi:serine phosphatase RsbU (regulator of sigma subunit)
MMRLLRGALAMPASRTRADDFFSIVSRSAVLTFFAAVFFTFAPISLLLMSSFEQRRPLWTLVWAGAVSGLLAVSWAATFTVSRRFAVGIVVFTVAIVAFSGPLREGPLGFGDGRGSLPTMAVVLSVVAGYVLFIVFISGQGRRTVRLQTEMALASEIHRDLVPPLQHRGHGIEALGASRASTEMGGDLVDVIAGDQVTDLVLADVSGHGVRAGVVMGMLKSALHMGLEQGRGLDALAGRLNDVIEATTSASLYATVAALRIHHGEGRGEYLLAGHHPILRVREGEVERLGGPAMPLGMMAGTTYGAEPFETAKDDLLVLYTDGLNETADEADRELGHEAIERCLAERAGRPLEEIRDALFALAEGHGSQEDDRSLLLVRIE